jgi:hypothetical protein
MTPSVRTPTTDSVGSPPVLIPSESAVHVRLSAVCREARFLRRLLRLCREVTAISADLAAIPANEKGVAHVT